MSKPARVAITDCVGVADCGTVIHPQSMATQIKGGAVQGFGMALGERHFFDPKFGLSGSRGLYASRIPTYLDGPLEMQAEAVNQPDPVQPHRLQGAWANRPWARRLRLWCAPWRTPWAARISIAFQ